MKKFFSFFGTFIFAASLSIPFAGCSVNKANDLFKYDPTANQSEWIITGIEKENGDGILEIPEKIDGKPVTQILSLDYRPNNEETSLHFTEIEKISIPKNVKLISPFSCRDMVGLQEVLFTEDSQLEKIEQGAFAGCKNLQSIPFPESLNILEGEVFDGCESLTSLHLPKNLVQFGRSFHCGITTLTIDEENQTYSIVDNVLYNKDKTILEYYPMCKPDEEFTILDSATQIVGEAFSNCKNLKNVHLGNVTKIGRCAFMGCENIMEITADKLLYVDEYPFNDTAWYKNHQGGEISLGKVLLSYTKFAFALDLSGYRYIAPYAFQGHKDLHSITFDNELTSIGTGAFKDCTNLYEVIFHNRSAMVFIGENVFENNATNRFFKVYEPLYEEYIENNFWQTYKDNITTYQ